MGYAVESPVKNEEQPFLPKMLSALRELNKYYDEGLSSIENKLNRLHGTISEGEISMDKQKEPENWKASIISEFMKLENTDQRIRKINIQLDTII